MAVYTDVEDEELLAFLAHYDLGPVVSFKGIAEGVENSNYVLQTADSSFILTLYEKRVNPDDLPFFLSLLNHLAERGIPCPLPVTGRDGRASRELCGRRAALFTFLPGVAIRRPLVPHCAALGEALARLHLAADSFPMRRANDLSIAGWRKLQTMIGQSGEIVQAGLTQAIAEELDTLEAQWPRDLPRGIVHADLFPDNVFFLGETLSGLIDFYFACTDMQAYDLAVCMNAWCFERDGSFNVTKSRALIGAYSRVRPLQEDELAALPMLARGSAMRFLLTRLYDWLNTPADAFVTRKDPMEYWRKLSFHRQVPSPGEYGVP